MLIFFYTYHCAYYFLPFVVGLRFGIFQMPFDVFTSTLRPVSGLSLTIALSFLFS